MFDGLFDPRLLVRMSCTPAHSSTARTGPPAITPVPCPPAEAAPRPPQWPWISCGIVPLITGTFTIARRAASSAFRTASDTSFAFPVPTPTFPCWSPTATSAAKEKRRPPLTTLATRLMWMTFSFRSDSRRDPGRPDRPPPPPPPGPPPAATTLLSCHASPLELEAALAGAVRESLHTAVVQIPTAVEDDLRDPLLLRALGQQLAGEPPALRLGQLTARVRTSAESVEIPAASPRVRRRRAALEVVQRAVDDQPRPLARPRHLLPNPAVAANPPRLPLSVSKSHCPISIGAGQSPVADVPCHRASGNDHGRATLSPLAPVVLDSSRPVIALLLPARLAGLAPDASPW
jgi:hypothetical protein